MRVRWAFLFGLGVAACAPLPPPRAIVAVHAVGGLPRNTVLVVPTTCASSEMILGSVAICEPSSAPNLTFDNMIAPILRVKLELAGYTLVDARSLRLETAERIDVTTDGEASSRVTKVPTVAELSPADTMAAAESIGLGAILVPTLHVTHRKYVPWLELVLELRAVPDGAPLWTARCSESVENPEVAANLVANCVGDGVLAWRAPDALIGRTP